MKIRKKTKWMALNLIGLGVALGSSMGTSVSGAQDLVISNGDTVIQDMIGVPGGADTVQVDQSSTWKGKLSVDQGGGAEVGISDNSTWEGELLLNGGYTHVQLTDSSWNGDIYGMGDLESGYSADVNVELQNSQRTGNVIVEDGSFYASLENSSLLGDAKVTNGYNSVNLNNHSTWEGDYSLAAIDQSNASGYVSISEYSSWKGDATISLQNNAQTGNFNMNIYNNSVWQGNLELNYQNQNPDHISQTYINMGNDSQWFGNWKTAGNVATHAYLYDNALWVGDLDISQNTLEEEYNQIGVGDISLWDHSTWQGKVISGDSRGIALYMEDESNWNMTDHSKLAYLSTNDSGISFMPKGNGTFSTLTVDGNFDSYNTLYAMNTDIAGNVGDLIDIKGTITGDSNKIQVNNQGSAWVNIENELTIVKTVEGGEADYFTLNNAVEVGGFEYGLKQVGTNWNLYSTGNLTSTAQSSMNLVSGSYLLNYAENQTLLQRMGELRDSEHKQGVWARVYGGEFTSSSNGMLDGYKMKYTGLQVGRDKKFDLGENRGDIYFGGMFGYGKASLDYGNGSGNVDSKTLGLYGTYVNPNGFYADAVLKYNKMKNDYKVIDTAGVGIKGEDINTDGLHLSLEVGQRIHLDRQEKSGWYVEPQAQLSWGQVTGGDFSASNGLRIHVEDYNTLIGRVGALVGYEVKGGKNPLNVYGKVSYVHEFDGDIGYRFNGISVNDSFGDSWIVYGVGATAQIGKSHNLYLDIERASGGQFNQPWAVSGGYRFTW